MEQASRSLSGSEEVRCEPRAQPNPDLVKLLQFKVYRRRWFILLVLCLLNCSNAMVGYAMCAREPGEPEAAHCGTRHFRTNGT